MKTLKVIQLENVQGGQDELCGAGVAAAIIFPNPFTIIAALTLCTIQPAY